jgi:hypothetical protein
MNIKTTLVLAALLVVVAAVVLFTESGKSPEASPQPQGDQGRQLVDLQSGDVTRVTIVSATGDRTSLRKTGTAWDMTEPVKSPAVEWTVQQLVSSLVGLQSQGRPESDPGSAAGLDSPRYRVELATDGGKTVVLAIGNKTAIGDTMYARVNDGDINLIDSSIEKSLKTAASDLRDKHLLSMKDYEVKQFRITYGNKQLMLAKNGGKWQILQPEPMPADDSAVSSLLLSITGTEATEFMKSDSPELLVANFDKPTLQVWLSKEAPTTQPSSSQGGVTLTIGMPTSLTNDHYFAQTSDGLTAKIASSMLDPLKKTALDLRDKDVATILPASVKRISILRQTYPVPSTQPTTQAATQTAGEPTTRPISSQTIVLVQRPVEAPATAPTTTPATMASTTVPTTTPTTVASATQPTTQPVEPPSAWELADAPKDQLDDSKVAALLADFQPLKAEKYLENALAAGTTEHYTIELTADASGGQPGGVYRLEVSKSSSEGNPVATYNGLTFEISSGFLDAVNADFHKGRGEAIPAPAPAMPQMMPMQ